MIFDMNDLNGVEKMIINRVKKTMLESGVKSVLMTTDDDTGEVMFETFTEPVRVFTLTQINDLLTEVEKSVKQLSNGNSNTATDTANDTATDTAADTPADTSPGA